MVRMAASQESYTVSLPSAVGLVVRRSLERAVVCAMEVDNSGPASSSTSSNDILVWWLMLNYLLCAAE